MITDLLPRYYEAHDAAGHTGRYEILRSIMIDGHEVAWMKYSSTIVHDIMGLGREGQPVESNGLHCECYFTEGVGWQTDEKYGVTGLVGDDDCIRQQAAQHLRYLELNAEYRKRYKNHEMSAFGLHGKIDDIVADLIERDKRGEFIGEAGSGAHFWGGHFYLYTVAKVMGTEQEFIIDEINRMVQEKKIRLEGFVVREYRKPPRPSWSKDFRHERDGYRVTAYLPNNSTMKQQYKLKLQASDKSVVKTEYIDLFHAPIFGPDVDDVSRAKAKADEMIEEAISSQS